MKRKLCDLNDDYRPYKQSRFDSISIKVTIKLGNISKFIYLSNVNPHCSLFSLSQMICESEKLDASKTTIVYSFAFESLSDSLRVCGITNECNLCIGIKFKDNECLHRYADTFDKEKMIIFVQTLTGKTIWILCKEMDKILKIKKYIFECDGIPINEQRLLRDDGHCLNNYQSLKQCNVKNRDCVHLILRLLH